MAKRFTDTEIWRKKWFRSLKPRVKLFFYYLKDNCNCAGIWEEDMEAASFHLGCDLDRNEIIEALPEHIQMIKDNKWYLTKFVEFQYGTLNENCNPHKAVIRTLKKYKLRVGQPLKRDKSKVKEQEQDMDKVKDKDIEVGNFKKIDEFKDIDIDREFSKFNDWILANGKKYKDYNAAFRNWLRNSKNFNGGSVDVASFKLDTTGNAYIGYCSKCSVSGFYSKIEIRGNSKCCDALLLPKLSK